MQLKLSEIIREMTLQGEHNVILVGKGMRYENEILLMEKRVISF